jgi:hypothetical protein
MKELFGWSWLKKKTKFQVSFFFWAMKKKFRLDTKEGGGGEAE